MAIDSGDVKATLVLNIKKFLRGIQDATSSVDDMADDIGDSLDGIVDDADSSFKGMAGISATFGASLATAGGAVGASLLAMTDNFKDTKKSLNSFGAQTGITGKELDGFKSKIESTYLKGYGDDIQEVSDTYSMFQRELKLSSSETENLTEKAFQLREVWGIEVEDTMRSSSQLIKQFGVDGTEATDLIARAFQVAGDRGGDLIDTIDEYSQYFSQAGYSADEMFNVLLKGVDAGVRNFDVIGDAVKEFGVSITQSGTEGNNALIDLFGSAKKVEQLMKDVGNGTLSTKDAMVLVVEELAKTDDKVEQASIGAELFGGLWDEVGIKGLNAITSSNDALGEYDGTLQKANETLKGQAKTMEQVKREFEQVTNQLGEQFAPILSTVLDIASKVILKILEFSKANPIFVKFVAIGALVISVLGTIAGALIALGAFIAPIIAGIQFLGTVLLGISSIAGTVVAFFMSMPVLIGVAIVALVALIIWKWDEIKAFTISAWTTIVNFILSVPEKITNIWILFVTFMLGLWERFKISTIENWNKLLNFIKSVPSILYNFFTTTLPFFIGYVIGAFVKLVITVNQKIYQFFVVTIPNTINNFWNFVKNLFTRYIPQLIASIAMFVVKSYTKFQQMKSQLIQKAREILTGVINYFKQLPSKIASTAQQAYVKSIYLGKRMWDGLKSKIKNFPRDIKKIILNAISGIGRLGSNAYSALKNIGSSMWSGFKKGLGINSPSYIEEAMFAIDNEGENLRKNLFNTFRSIKKLPQINSLAELTKRQQQQRNQANEDNRMTQNFNAPLVQIEGGNDTIGKRTAYNLYDLITFKKRAMGVE